MTIGFGVAAVSIELSNTITNQKKKKDQIILYHATNNLSVKSILNGIDLGKGRSKLDFGQGFYVTTSASQAESWIKNKFSGKGAVMVFVVDEDVLENYKGKTFETIWSVQVRELSNFVSICREKGCKHSYDYV